MDTTLTFAPKTVAAMPYVAEREPPRDNKVPVVRGFEGAATLPANKPFIAQVVTARLSGTAFPETTGEIAPAERTLRPYGTPMLPSEDKTAETQPAESPRGETAKLPRGNTDDMRRAVADTTETVDTTARATARDTAEPSVKEEPA